MGHLDHVWSYGVREVVSSIPDRGNIVGWVFHPTRWLARLPHLNMPFLLNLFRTLSSWGSGNYRLSARLLYEVASHVKQLPFRPLLYSRTQHIRPLWIQRKSSGVVCRERYSLKRWVFDSFIPCQIRHFCQFLHWPFRFLFCTVVELD